MKPPFLRPFWRYFGAKWKLAPRYPAPRHTSIVEPFAGAAGYSLRHFDRDITLVEKYPVVAAVWRYLTLVSVWELERIPTVEHVDELPSWCTEEARWLVGFRLGAGDSRPRDHVSPMRFRDGAWGVHHVAHQVEFIRHWKVIEGDYTAAPSITATWFVDSPYQVAGSRSVKPGARGRVRYPHGGDAIDYKALGRWCLDRTGQVIACENVGADWLPFVPFADVASTVPGGRSQEAVWLS